MVVSSLLVLVLTASLASASHFYGGSNSFTARRDQNGVITVVFRPRLTFRGTGIHSGISLLSCNHGSCNGQKNITRIGKVDVGLKGNARSNTDYTESETVISTAVSSNQPFQLRYASCCYTTHSRSWSLLTLVDLGTRSDTRKPNSSPAITGLPFLRVPANCPRSFNLLNVDPDGDQVRCRFGTLGTHECASCIQPTGFRLDAASCTLRSSSSCTVGSHIFELVVEDFPRRSITLDYTNGSRSYASPSTLSRPLSKIPLHFSFHVDSAAPSCTEGVYLPRLLHPTPRHGEQLQAEVNKVTEIRVKAQASLSTIYDLVFSGPININKTRTTRDEFVLRWIPVHDELGQHFPICFAVEASRGSSIYQSEMRCVVVKVGLGPVKAQVSCNQTAMTVEVDKASFRGHVGPLRLNDANNVACRVDSNGNSSHFTAVVPLSGCGTILEEDANNLIFKNIITTDSNSLITRKRGLEVEFYCLYPKRGNLTLSFTAHRSNVTVEEKGFGTFTYQFEFFHSRGFTSMIDPNSYPLEYDVGDPIYMEIEATSSVNNTELFVESCRASPYDNPSYQQTYSIIEHGCAVDATVEILSPRHQKHFQFTMEAFKFIGLHDQVYISCSVILCEAGNPRTRCSQGCIRSGSPARRRRDAAIQTSNHFVSQGPLRLRRSTVTERESTGTSMNLNMNLVFIAGCLLAAVAMICAVVLYKAKKTAGGKYQAVPSTEEN